MILRRSDSAKDGGEQMASAGSIRCRRESRRSTTLDAAPAMRDDPTTSSVFSDQSDAEHRVLNIRSLYEGVASRILEESGMGMQSRPPKQRRPQARLKRGPPSPQDKSARAEHGAVPGAVPGCDDETGSRTPSSGAGSSWKLAASRVSFCFNGATEDHGACAATGSTGRARLGAGPRVALAAAPGSDPSTPESGQRRPPSPQSPVPPADEEAFNVRRLTGGSRCSVHSPPGEPPRLPGEVAASPSSIWQTAASPSSIGQTGQASVPSRGSTIEFGSPMRRLGTAGSFTRPMTHSQVLECRVNELVHVIPSEYCHGDRGGDGYVDARCAVFERALLAVFRIGGLLSWGDAYPALSMVYRCLIVLATGCLFMETSLEVAMSRAGSCSDFVWPRSLCGEEDRLITEVLIGGAAFLVEALLGLTRGARCRDDLLSMLQGYANHHDVWELWHKSAARDAGVMLLIFVCIVVIHITGALQYSGPHTVSKWLHACTNISIIGVLMLHFTFLLYVLRMLVVTVDVFCYTSVQDPNVSRAADSWNVLQALLRKASTMLEFVLIVFLAMAASSVPALILDHIALGSFSKTLRLQSSHTLVICGVLYVFMVAAAVTDKCKRVPSLLNSLCFGVGRERQRLHLVEYIVYSAAGFYIWGVRLTLEMVTKFIYVWFVILFAFVGQERTND